MNSWIFPATAWVFESEVLSPRDEAINLGHERVGRLYSADPWASASVPAATKVQVAALHATVELLDGVAQGEAALGQLGLTSRDG